MGSNAASGMRETSYCEMGELLLNVDGGLRGSKGSLMWKSAIGCTGT